MENKNLNLWKILLFIVTFIMLTFVILTARKFIILSSLNNKVVELQKTKNIYARIISNSEETKSQTVEIYFKDNIRKDTMEIKNSNNTINEIIQITYPNKQNIYIYDGLTKEMASYDRDNSEVENNMIVNFADYTTLFEGLSNAITSKIKVEEIDGKKCYILSSLSNSNIIYEEGTTEALVYIEKDTGIPIKIVSTINKNGSDTKNTITYEYKFDCVTENDIEEPDISEYTLKNN